EADRPPGRRAGAAPARLGLSRFLAVEAERLDHRPVADREEVRSLAAGVLVGVLRPARQRDDVALRPVEGLAVNDAAPLAAHYVEHGASRDAARLQLLALAQKLDAAGDGGRDRP